MASQDRQRWRNPAWNTNLTAPTARSSCPRQLGPPNGGYQGGHPVELIVVVPPTQGPAGPGWPVRCSEGGQNGLDQVGRLVGNIVGMAYVVARPKGRFEIRESVHTPKGPRARSLANFPELTDDVLATRPSAGETSLRCGCGAGSRRPCRRAPSPAPRDASVRRSLPPDGPFARTGPPAHGPPGSRRRPHRPSRFRGKGEAVRTCPCPRAAGVSAARPSPGGTVARGDQVIGEQHRGAR